MDGVSSALQSLIQKAERNRTISPNDYRSTDGILYCGICHEPKECFIDLDGEKKKVYCMCACDMEKYRKEKEEEKAREKNLFIESLRVHGIQDRALQKYTFETAEDTKYIQACKRYVNNWDKYLKENVGILMYGTPGTGKTFAATCIANALIEKFVPVLMTSFPRILNAGYDKSEIVNSMKEFQMLVIDDLGVERTTPYALEIVQFIVDERYKSGLPTIITTNLSKKELNNPQNMEYQRIYDRVMEMCVPMGFFGESRRKENARRKEIAITEIFK